MRLKLIGSEVTMMVVGRHTDLSFLGGCSDPTTIFIPGQVTIGSLTTASQVYLRTNLYRLLWHSRYHWACWWS